MLASARSKFSTAPKKNGPSTAIDEHARRAARQAAMTELLLSSCAVCCCTSTLLAMRRRKCSVARITPMFTATTRSTNTVKRERHEQNDHVGGRRAPNHLDEVPRLAHVPGDDEQDRGERGERHVHGQRRQEQHDEHQRQRMNDAGERTRAAVAHVRRSPCDRAGRGEAAEQRRDDVRDALPDQLLIGVVTRARHAVGDHGRQQRLDRAEHRDRERRTDQLDDSRGRHCPGTATTASRRECRRRRCRSWRRPESSNVACSERGDDQPDAADRARASARASRGVHDHDEQAAAQVPWSRDAAAGRPAAVATAFRENARRTPRADRRSPSTARSR